MALPENLAPLFFQEQRGVLIAVGRAMTNGAAIGRAVTLARAPGALQSGS
jgi:hypothetical protein